MAKILNSSQSHIILILLCFSFSSSITQITKTVKQTTTLFWRGLESKNYYINNLFLADQKNADSFLHILGKTIAEKNEGFRLLNNSKISSAQVFFEVTNVAVDDDLNSVLNLTVILKANKGIPDAQKELMNKKNVHKIAKTEPKTQVDKNKSTKEQNRGKPNAFDILVLQTHNTYRKKHNVPPLKYSEKISKVSQDWADYLAEHSELTFKLNATYGEINNNKLKHRPNAIYGENIYAVVSSNRNYKVSGNEPVESWYSEIKNYTFTKEPSKDVIQKTGHFTQLVWKNSKELGIGVSQSKRTKVYYVVCNYYPQGNFIGQFKKNVLPPK